MKKIVYILPFITLLLLSCNDQRKQLSPNDYIAWAKKSEKDLVKVKEIRGYRFTSKLQPSELLVIKNMNDIASQEELDSLNKIQRGIVNIVLDIGSVNNQQSLLRANITDESEYYQRVFYYTSEVQRDLYLVEGTDTLRCAFYHFEQTYNLTPVNSMIMEFERINPDSEFEDLSLVYDDRILNTGIMKFSYKKAFLNNLPELKL